MDPLRISQRPVATVPGTVARQRHRSVARAAAELGIIAADSAVARGLPRFRAC
eukprot:COSAG02_NODE_2652_length_8323_cov_32.383268_8_plen_52_part_01